MKEGTGYGQIKAGCQFCFASSSGYPARQAKTLPKLCQKKAPRIFQQEITTAGYYWENCWESTPGRHRFSVLTSQRNLADRGFVVLKTPGLRSVL